MQESSSPPRRGIALALVVLAAVLAFVAILAIWVNRQVLNTDNWTAASSQLLERPVIRDQVAGFLTDELYDNVDVEGEIRAALPDRAQPLAGPLAGFLRGRIERRARQALGREKVQELWEDANRAAHEQLLRILEGGGPVVSTQGGAVVLNLKALLEETERRAGFGGRARRCAARRRGPDHGHALRPARHGAEGRQGAEGAADRARRAFARAVRLRCRARAGLAPPRLARLRRRLRRGGRGRAPGQVARPATPWSIRSPAPRPPSRPCARSGTSTRRC